VHFKTEIGKIYKPASGDREPRNKDPSPKWGRLFKWNDIVDRKVTTRNAR